MAWTKSLMRMKNRLSIEENRHLGKLKIRVRAKKESPGKKALPRPTPRQARAIALTIKKKSLFCPIISRAPVGKKRAD